MGQKKMTQKLNFLSSPLDDDAMMKLNQLQFNITQKIIILSLVMYARREVIN